MTRDTSLRQRPRRRYSFTQHGQSEQGQRHGNYLIKSGQADLWSPAYGQGVTTIRLFPAISLDNANEWDPYRWPATDPHDPLGFGDWIRRYPAVRSMGDPPVTFIQLDPAEPQIDDQQMTPGWLLFRAIDRAIASGQDRPGWASLMRGSRGRGAQLSRPSEVYVTQCAIMAYKNRPYNPPRGFGQDDKLCVMELGPSAGLAMINEMHREVVGFQGDPDDFAARYFNGNPIDLDSGRFVNFYTLKDGDPRQAQQAVQQGWNMGGGNQGAGGSGGGNSGGQEPIGYGCFMEEQFNGMPARLREFETAVRARVKPWDQILRFPTIEEQAHLLADKFPPEVIEYAWSSHPDWIPEEVHRRARAAAAVTTAGVPQGQPGQPGQPGQAPSQPQFSGAGEMPVQGGGWGGAAQVAPQQPQAGAGGFPTQQAPTGQQNSWGQDAPAQVDQVAQPAIQPVTQPVEQPVAQPAAFAAPVEQPVAQPAAFAAPVEQPVGGAMQWGQQPNVAAPTALPSDPAIVPGNIPASSVPQAPVPQAPVQQAPVPQAPVPQAPVQQAPVQQAPVPQAPVPQAPMLQVPQVGISPPENNPVGGVQLQNAQIPSVPTPAPPMGVTQQSFDPAPVQPQAMTPAQQALARAQAARAGQPNQG